MKTELQLDLYGATIHGDETEFRLWAPALKNVALKLWRASNIEPELIPMQHVKAEHDSRNIVAGSWSVTVPARAGDLYQYTFNDLSVPDPVSRHLPEGVHGRTEIVNNDEYRWSDQDWHGQTLANYVVYELHIGTFTPGGTFDSAIEKLDYLKALGATAIEVMPVNAFPGTRNWGYDGVSMYAVQASYGGPRAFQRFVDEAHRRGLAVILDVVYNHLGNEGNYLSQFGPYFTPHHRTPWGDALNYDNEGSEAVRQYIVGNSLYWLSEYHLDGLRLDAIQNIKDDSKQHIVAEIAKRGHELGGQLNREIVVTVETDENDARNVLAPSQSGYGADAMWSDDFHHAVHAIITHEHAGYYQDFGPPELLSRSLTDGYAFQGEYFAFWKKPRGTSAAAVPLQANVICLQNHDQVGNRAHGERVHALMPRGARKAIAPLLLLAPETPLIFMGEEYDEATPFQFFTDYSDPDLQKAVSEGRCSEFADFDFREVPDPQDRATFERSRLTWKIDGDMLEWYRELLRLRREYIISSERTCAAEWKGSTLKVQIPSRYPRVLIVVGFEMYATWKPDKEWRRVLCSNQDNYSAEIYLRS